MLSSLIVSKELPARWSAVITPSSAPKRPPPVSPNSSACIFNLKPRDFAAVKISFDSSTVKAPSSQNTSQYDYNKKYKTNDVLGKVFFKF